MPARLHPLREVIALVLSLMVLGCVQPIDVGSNSELSSSENTADGGSIPCGPACEVVDAGVACRGTATIETLADWDRFAAGRCTGFDGDVQIRIDSVPDAGIELLNDVLERVSGQLWVNAAVRSMTFSKLEAVGAGLDVAPNVRMVSLRFPALTTCGPTSIVGTAALAELDLPSLREVRGVLSLSGNGALTTVNLPALTRAIGVSASDNGALNELHAPQLSSTDTLSLLTNGELTTLDLPSLRSVSSAFNATNNTKLRQCVVDRLMEQLTTPPVSFRSANNNGVPDDCTP